MSAGGLSYSGLRTYGKASLPSVEGWGTNLNILRDPPKSIMTRRINKVGSTSNITDTIDASGDRACEAILKYARGVNPMVSVNYGNNGTNGGQRSTLRGGGQAFLPYRIMRDGAFRPPVKTQEQLLPLSRQPRPWVSVSTNKVNPDFTKRLRDCGTAKNTIEVHTTKPCIKVTPSMSYKVERPLDRPYETQFKIKENLKTSAHSGFKGQSTTPLNVAIPCAGIQKNPIHSNAHTNLSHISEHNTSTKYTEPYTQDVVGMPIHTNMSHTRTTPLDQMREFGGLPVHAELIGGVLHM